MIALRQYARQKPILHLILLAALVVGTGLVVLSATAAGEGGETEYRWLLTPNAAACTSSGFCDADPNGYTVCREECLVDVSSGQEYPTGEFRCFPF